MLGVAAGAGGAEQAAGAGAGAAGGLVVLLLAWRRRAWLLLAEATLFAGLPAIAIAGWWFWRNIQLYGDWSGLGHLMAINGRRGSALEWEDIPGPSFAGCASRSWGLFGWFNILLPAWFYRLMDAVTVVGLAGAVLLTLRRWRTRSRDGDRGVFVVLMLWMWLAMMALLLLYWTLQATGSQGRLLFPAIAAFVTLLAGGIDFWLRWLPARGRGVVWGALLGVLVAMSVYALGWLLPRSYNGAGAGHRGGGRRRSRSPSPMVPTSRSACWPPRLARRACGAATACR